jgi:6-phosphogluconolactonase
MDLMPESAIIAGPDGAVAEAMIYRDERELIEGAAKFIANAAAESIVERGRFSIALAGGNTPKPVYERLASADLDWTRVIVAFGDERCVPPDDPRSNYLMVKAALLDRVPIPPENVLRMRGEDPPDEAAARYAEDLQRTLGEGWRLDFVPLGLGDDGHTASLFPGLAAVAETKRPVAACYVEVMGMWRLTLTPPAINAARRVAFLVSGAGKAEILHRVLQGPRKPMELPAQAIRPTERPALWLIDAAAAAKLKR